MCKGPKTGEQDYSGKLYNYTKFIIAGGRSEIDVVKDESTERWPGAKHEQFFVIFLRLRDLESYKRV